MVILLTGTIYIAIFTNLFTTKFVTSYIKINNKLVNNKISNIVLSPEKINRFEIKNPLLKNKNKTYTLSIVPVKADHKIEYTVNGYKYDCRGEKELTDYFDITYREDSFSIDGNFTLKTILEQIYPGCDIYVDDKYMKPEEDLYQLVFKSKNTTLLISFRSHMNIDGIQLREKLVFEELGNGKIITR